jgi:hypothetical protein
MGVEVDVQALDLGQERVRVAQQDLRGRREPYPAAVALDHGRSHVGGQRRELLRDGGRG